MGVAKRLSGGFRTTLLDFDGFGKTPEPNFPMTVSDYAAKVETLMAELGISSAVFVAHSFGGRVALEIAARRPHLCQKLVLIDSAGMRPRRGLKYYLKVFLHKLRRRLGLRGLSGSKDYAALSPVMRETFKNVVNYNQKPLLSHIYVTTAIFWGKSDRETKPYMARVLHKKIQGSALFWLDGGHFAYIEDFAKFFAILWAFVAD
jgi:pimeloyl-ACP methyl ester carboxylesterase